MGKSSDGSIILKTHVDTSGISSGMKNSENTVKKGVKGITSALSTLGLTISAAAFVKFSNDASKAATNTEASIMRLVDIYGTATETVGDFIDENARAIGMSKSAATSFSAVYGNLFSVWADQNTNAQLTTEYLNMTAVVASKTGRTMEDVQERIRSGLLGNTEAVEDLGIFVNVKTIEMTESFKKLADGRSWDQLNAYEQSQVRTLAIMEQATQKYGNEVAETTSLTRARYQAAYEDFRNSWGKIINTVLMPVLEVATEFFDIMTTGLQVLSGISEKTVDPAVYESQAGAIKSSVKNQEKLTDAVEETAKAQEKATAGFDNINILSDKSASTAENNTTADTPVGGASAGGASGESVDNKKISNKLATIMAAAGAALIAIGLIMVFTGSIAWGIGFIIAGAALFAVSIATLSKTDQGKEIIATLTKLMIVVGIALIAIGLIMVFSGSIAWGIGFIIAGAALVGAAMFAAAKSGVGEETIGMLATIMGVVGGALVAIGVILIMLGSTAVGVGFIIAGAALLIGSVAELVGFDVASVENVLKMIMGIAGGALLALGIMLCIFGGPSPLSIGLIAAGAISLAAAVALNFEAVTKALKGPIGKIVALVGSILLVLGIILCCTGVALPLGIALIAAGAAGLATVVALNWNGIWEKTKSVFNAIFKWIKTWGLLILGIILTLSGVGMVLGIPLIMAGAKSLTKAQSPLWNTIVDKLKEVWNKIKSFWNKHIKPIFTLQWWKNLAKKAGNGLISGFEAAVNGIIGMFEKMINWIVKGINKLSFKIPSVVPGIGGKKIGFNLKEVEFSRISIPRLAKGGIVPYRMLAEIGEDGKEAVIPLEKNTEWMDILADKIANRSGVGSINVSGSGSWSQFMRFLKIELDKEGKRASAWG